MKERPILFSAPMVRAILAGTKTVTRRVVKPQPESRDGWDWSWPIARKGVTTGTRVCWRADQRRPGGISAYCPYGVPGDRLYVKEACWIWGRWTLNGLTSTGRQRWRFRAEPEHRVRFDRPERTARRESPQPGFDGLPGWVYRHARFMPRWASRITLDVVSVRVERVQEIAPEDCSAEGVEYCGEVDHDDCSYGTHGWRCSFERLWDSMNAPRGFGWNVNPWVWRIEFKRVSP